MVGTAKNKDKKKTKEKNPEDTMRQLIENIGIDELRHYYEHIKRHEVFIRPHNLIGVVLAEYTGQLRGMA